MHGLVTLDYPKGKSLPTIAPSPAAMKVNPGLELTACLMSTVTVFELQGTSLEGAKEGKHLCVVGASGDPWVCKSGDPWVCASGDPRMRASGDPRVDVSGDPWVCAGGDPRVRASGDPRVCANLQDQIH